MLKNSNRTIKAFLFLLALLLSASAQQQTITGKVVGVSEGDTITVLDASNKQHKIRLEGAELPRLLEGIGAEPRTV